MEKMDKPTVREKLREPVKLGKLSTPFIVLTAAALALLILGWAVNPFYYFMLAPLVIIYPLLSETGMLKEPEERTCYISYRSSHIALYGTLLALSAILISQAIANPELIDPAYFIVLIVPIAYKLLATIALTYSTRVVGLGIGYIYTAYFVLPGIFYAIYKADRLPVDFVAFALVAVVITVTGHWLPRFTGLAYTALALYGLAGAQDKLGTVLINGPDYFGETVLDLSLQLLLIVVPLLMAGLLLLFTARKQRNTD
jgi:hypothetical protein